MPISAIQIRGLRGRSILLAAAGTAIILAGCGKSTNEKLHEAIDGSVQAAMLYNEQNYVKALSEIHHAIAMNTDLNRDSALGENYQLLAHCQRKLGAYDSSLEAFNASLEYFHLFGDQRLERRGRIALAELSYDLHNYRDAMGIAAAAAAEGKVFSDSQNSFQASLLVAKVYHKLHNYAKEIDILNDLLDDPSQQNGSESRQDLWKMIFEATRCAGDTDSLQALFNRWRTSSPGADSSSTAGAYVAWGHYQESLTHPDIAIRAFSQALNLLGGRSKREMQAQVLTSLGSLSYRGKRYENARLYFADALTLAKQENNIILEQSLNLMQVACDWKIAGARPNPLLSREFEKRCSDAAAVCAQTAFLKGEAFALFLRGLVAERRSDSAAIAAYKEALKLKLTNVIQAEEDRSVTDDLLRAILEVEGVEWYDPLLRLLCSSMNSAEVFSYAEERNLREIEEYFSRLSFQPPDPNLQAAVLTITQQRNALQLLQSDILNELAGGRQRNLERFESLKELLPQRLAELTTSVGSLEGSNYRWLLFPKPLSLKMIRDTIPPRTGLIEYITLENQLFILLITRDTVLLRSAGVTRQHLLSSIREYNSHIGDARLNSDAPMFDPAAAQRRINELSPVLHSWLIEPILGSVGSLSKIFIVPPPEYGYLPFHTLRSSGGSAASALINKTDVSYLPAAAVLLFRSAGEQPVRDIVGFGHPGGTGWDVEYEVRDIRGFFDKAKMFFDTTATLGHLTRVTCDLLHLAAPFSLHVDLPDSSGMMLSDGITPDGVTLVSLGAMMSIQSPQTFVFSNVSPEAGGLWRYPALASLAGGSQTVIFTMWQGERKAKKYFGEAFYTNLMAGTPSSASYHLAMMAMTKNEETLKPHQWGLYFKFGR